MCGFVGLFFINLLNSQLGKLLNWHLLMHTWLADDDYAFSDYLKSPKGWWTLLN